MISAQSWPARRRPTAGGPGEPRKSLYSGLTVSDHGGCGQPGAGTVEARVRDFSGEPYGPPGTGKATALRALAHGWLPWCDTDCVLDPEVLFSDPGYLMEAALGDEDGENAGRWRLLLLEDCDELIGGDAKRASGQALSRLLNLTDGLLGQGRRVLVAITTNEDIRSLHPAVIRPGRCLPRSRSVRCRQPMRQGGACDVVSPLTLADLYARRYSGAPISSAQPTASVGLYL